MGFGFVIVKFALFIRQITIALGQSSYLRERILCHYWGNYGSTWRYFGFSGISSLSEHRKAA
jgi:hypothetical protein